MQSITDDFFTSFSYEKEIERAKWFKNDLSGIKADGKKYTTVLEQFTGRRPSLIMKFR